MTIEIRAGGARNVEQGKPKITKMNQLDRKAWKRKYECMIMDIKTGGQC